MRPLAPIGLFERSTNVWAQDTINWTAWTLQATSTQPLAFGYVWDLTVKSFIKQEFIKSHPKIYPIAVLMDGKITHITK
jgi:hypothetical protein